MRRKRYITFTRCALAWVAIEVTFFYAYKYRQRQMNLSVGTIVQPQQTNSAAAAEPQLSPGILYKVLAMCARHRWSEQRYQQFIQEWFGDVPMDSIGRDNVAEWVAYMSFDKELTQLTKKESSEVSRLVRILEARAKVNFPPGRNPSVHAMRHSLDPIFALPIPLTFYAVVGFLNLVARGVLTVMGFQPFQTGVLSGWVHINPTESAATTITTATATAKVNAEKREPVVFIGGLGIGKLPYLPFLYKLLKETGKPLIILDMPQVNLALSNLWHPMGNVPTIDAVLQDFPSVLRVPELRSKSEKGEAPATCAQSACFVAHSYGSIYVSWILRERPTLAKGGVVFIDPVPFLLFEPDVIANMLYRNRVSGPISTLIRGELNVRYTVQRHFFWQRNVLFTDVLPFPKVAVMMGVTDNMIPVQKIVKYFESERVDKTREGDLTCQVFNCRHGAVIWTLPMQREIIRRIKLWQPNHHHTAKAKS